MIHGPYLRRWQFTTQSLRWVWVKLTHVRQEILVPRVTTFSRVGTSIHNGPQTRSVDRHRCDSIDSVTLESPINCMGLTKYTRIIMARLSQFHHDLSVHTSCIIKRTFVAYWYGNATRVVFSALLFVENASTQCSPSSVVKISKDLAGNSHDIDADCNLLCPPKSIVSVAGSLISNSLAQ